MLRPAMTSTNLNRPLLGGALAAAALVLLPGAALGATVQRVGSVIKYDAAPGETNHVTARPIGASYVIDDTGAPAITDADGTAGCRVAGTRVVCSLSGLVRVEIGAGDGADYVKASGATRVVLSGGDGDDTLTGGAGKDLLYGQNGADTLTGAAGADDLAGGGGTDKVSYAGSTEPEVVDLDGLADDGSADDGPAGARDRVRTDVERLRGGTAGDQLTGGSARNVLEGYEGDDVLSGGGGPDLLRGGTGADTVTYAGRAQGVSANLDGTADDGSAEDGPAGARDTIATDVENLTGTDGDDSLVGDDGPNRLEGGAGGDGFDGRGGNDVERGGEGRDVFYEGGQANGADVLDGQDGSEDLAYYISRTTAVALSLDGAANDGQAGEGDDIQGVEDLFGGSGDDQLTGDSGANTLTGYAGADTIDGQDGNDRLLGYEGADKLDGGAGNDRVDGGYGADTEHGGTGDDTFTPTSCGDCGDNDDDVQGDDGADTLDLSYRVVSTTINLGASNASGQDADFNGDPEEDDTYGGIETVLGTPARDRMTGLLAGVTFEGRGGDDLLTGSSGADTLLGGDGNDSIKGLDGNDNLNGGTGDDAFWMAYNADGSDDITGGDGTDTLDYGDRGANLTVSLNGYAGDGEAGEADNAHSDIERLFGGWGSDALNGTPGNDRIWGLGGNDYVYGGDGDDQLDGGSGNDMLNGETGADTLTGSFDDDRLFGLDGNDVLQGESGQDQLDGGTGNDSISGGDGNDLFNEGNAANGADDISCGGNGAGSVFPFDDRVEYYDGNIYNGRTVRIVVKKDDVANDGQDADIDQNGEEGDNVHTDCESIWGGKGNDFFEGSGGYDKFVGMEGNDGFKSNGGADRLEGREGDDVFLTRDGVKNSLDGGPGNDTAQYDYFVDSLVNFP
jgi:Ca2+-binding RTX toxin-like protein